MKVYGNGSVVKKGKGFLLRVVIGYGEDGEPIRKSKSAKTQSKRQADKLLREWIRELEAMVTTVEGEKMTVSELLQFHIDILDETKSVRPRTIDGYRKLKLYADKMIGSKLIIELTFADIEEFCLELKRTGGADGNSLSANTVIKVFTLIKAALKQAVKRRWIPYNPAIDANPFKLEKPEVHILSEDETRRFIARVLEYPRKDQAAAMLISVCCGTRRGEVCSLRWSDIDLDKQVVYLRNAVSEVSKQQGSGKTLHFDSPKNANGTRDIPIPDICADYLRKEKEEQRQRLAYFNLHQGEDTPVCANSKGGFMRPSNLSKFSKTFLLDNGFDPRLTLHSLRHGFVTHLLDRGMPANQIGQISGQTPKVVLDTYGNHRSEAVIQKLAAELNEITSLKPSEESALRAVS
ncbi:MAG: site-specific integrase [Coriobacteriia bacterium]|nr:site-specific integrase [Coriobacteriia bacterium]